MDQEATGARVRTEALTPSPQASCPQTVQHIRRDSVPFWIMPADCWITCWLTSKTASTILKVFVRIITATKVLNTHLKNIHVNFMEVVAFYEHLYQFIGHNKSEMVPGLAEWQFRRSVVSWKRPQCSSPPGL